LDGKKIFRRDCSETVWRQEGNATKAQMQSLVLDLSKIILQEDWENGSIWLSGIKALPDTNSYFLDRVFYLNRDKMTIFTGSKRVL
jgi:hypothetical protein